MNPVIPPTGQFGSIRVDPYSCMSPTIFSHMSRFLGMIWVERSLISGFWWFYVL